MIATSKTLVRTIAATVMLVPALSPAFAHDGYDGRGYGYGYPAANANHATNLCTRAVQGTAGRQLSAFARVTEIRDVDRIDRGFVVKGRLVVNARDRDWHRDGWRRDNIDYRSGWNDGPRRYDDRRYDEGSFRCRVEYGRITDLDFSGIRGL